MNKHSNILYPQNTILADGKWIFQGNDRSQICLENTKYGQPSNMSLIFEAHTNTSSQCDKHLYQLILKSLDA